MQFNLQYNPLRQPSNCCPNIGLKEDPATYSAFPSQMNACHHVRPVQAPKISHQRTYCLKSVHPNCPIFMAPAGKRMPKDIQLKYHGVSVKGKERLVIGGIATILIAIGVWILIGRPLFTIPIVETSPTLTQPTQTPLETALIAVATDPITPTTIPTRALLTPTVPLPTSTPKDPILSLDTPIGDEVQFVIHRVEEGETLQIFADQYNTTVEAISAINYDLIVPLWINWLVIIPLNISIVGDLPAFEAYQVVEEGVQVQDLAEQLSVSLDDMMRYNNLDAAHSLHEGEWLLIPRERLQP